VEADVDEIGKRAEPLRRKILLDDIPSPFLLPDEAAKYLRLEERTLANYRSSRTGPLYRRHGGKICYHRDDLASWSITNQARL